MSRAVMEERIKDLREERADRISRKYELPLEGHWDIRAAIDDIRKNKGVLVQVLNKPFDKRWTYYTGKTSGFMARPRAPIMRCGLIRNRILLTVRNPRRGNTDSFFVANTVVDKDGVSPFDNATVFPLYLPSSDDGQIALFKKRLNLGHSFLKALRTRLGLPGRDGAVPTGLTPEDIFHYAYTVFHSSGYRSRYAEFLKIDFPRLPLTGKLDLFRRLAHLGGELVALHLMESPKLDQFITSYVGPKNPEIEKVGWSDSIVWLNAAATKKGHPATPGTIGFRGVPEAVWNLRIGGYQVCDKWLKDRKGRTLSKEDIAHYQKIIVALAETIRLMKEIDEVIEAYGGWPGAFVQASRNEVEVRTSAETV
jgi:predicted helicase